MQTTAMRVLIEREQIAARVRELGQELAADLAAELRAEGSDVEAPDRIILLPVLAGAFVFTADLIRHMPLNLSIRLVTVSSYAGATTKSLGAQLVGQLPDDLEGRHVVIVDDILDSGRTLALLRRTLAERNPASLRICVLLRKTKDRDDPVEADYAGFDIPDEFVVGCGLDYNGQYRNLPDIMALEQP